MAESRKSSLNTPSGTTGNGVSGGGESGFHPQQMNQQFPFRVKYQVPTGLHQQRPVMISYEQQSVSQKQGPYAHQASYQILPHQQQQQLQQQQLQYQQQQLHQQQQLQQHQPMPFAQQSDNLQQPMQYLKDTQKSSLIQSRQNIKSSEVETQERKFSITPTAEEKTDKDATQTPAEVEKLTKEMEEQRAAHEKQVRDLEARIKALEEQKSEKEVKYLRVPESIQKKKQPKKRLQKKSPPGRNTRRKSAINKIQEKEVDSDTSEGPEVGGVFDSCPSPVDSMLSDVEIKEEPENDNPKLNVHGIIPLPREQGDTKPHINKETGETGEPPITYTLSVTDFDLCIICQIKTEKKLTYVTEDNLEVIQSIVLNVDCESSNRLKDYILDTDMFLNNLPQYHTDCQKRLKDTLKRLRNKRKLSNETDLLLCIFCQEHRSRILNNFTKKGFTSLRHELDNMDDEMRERLQKHFNLDRVKNIVATESAKEEFSPKTFKLHNCCRSQFRIKDRTRKSLKSLTSEPEKSLNTLSSEPENMEENVEITPDEEIFELLAKRKRRKEEEELRKERKELPEPNEFDYRRKCVLCGTSIHHRGKFKTIRDIAIQKTKESADKKQHSDIVKILEHAGDVGMAVLCHHKCYGYYNYSKEPYAKKGTFDLYETAFKPVVERMEEPMFRHGKVISLLELREIFIQNLKIFNIETEQKMSQFAQRVKAYYTFKKCRVKCLMYPDYFIYSNHLSEAQVAPQIFRMRKERENEGSEQVNTEDSNKDSSNIKPKKKWRFACTECGYKCYKKNSFQNHIKKHELKSIEEIVLAKQEMCEVCGKMLKNKMCLKIHLRMHSGEKFSCSQCDRAYYSKSALSSHELMHTGERNVECPECGKKFFAELHVKRHIKKVHGTSDKEYLCSVCGKSLRTKEKLKEHMRKHSDDRPFVCKECGKGFKYSSNLRTHLLAHEGKKPQMCSICSFGCMTKANLKLHMAKHTGNYEQMMVSSNEEENEKNVSIKYLNLDEDIQNIKVQTYFPL
ncbi:unnamed protein product, partial [Meganyctiphanes norvegica]